MRMVCDSAWGDLDSSADNRFGFHEQYACVLRKDSQTTSQRSILTLEWSGVETREANSNHVGLLRQGHIQRFQPRYRGSSLRNPPAIGRREGDRFGRGVRHGPIQLTDR